MRGSNDLRLKRYPLLAGSFEYAIENRVYSRILLRSAGDTTANGGGCCSGIALCHNADDIDQALIRRLDPFSLAGTLCWPRVTGSVCFSGRFEPVYEEFHGTRLQSGNEVERISLQGYPGHCTLDVKTQNRGANDVDRDHRYGNPSLNRHERTEPCWRQEIVIFLTPWRKQYLSERGSDPDVLLVEP
jgi:hypothetical protein